jgi:hypothetical protein
MTTVAELSNLQRYYAEVSHRFRAGWTFHQFIQSLGKTLLQRVEDLHSSDFQELYGGLKEISQNLNAAESEKVRGRLEAIDQRLAELLTALDEEDNKITPDLLRQFFRRVKNYDEKILTQLVKFYLYVHPEGPWALDRLDKLDFLLARLSEEVDDRTGELVLRNHQRLAEIFGGLWALVGAESAPDQLVDEWQSEAVALRHEVQAVETLDQLNERGLVQKFRSLKHSLGPHYFQPDLLLPVQETNLAFKSRIQSLYRQEEQRIVAEYQRVFELEREVPLEAGLDRELSEFREEIERFENQLQKEEFRLGDLAAIRQRVRSLLPRLTAVQPARVEPPASVKEMDSGEHMLLATQAAATERLAGPQEDLIGEYYRQILAILKEMSPEMAPERVVLIPEVFAMRLEPREIDAYRRLYGRRDCDRELEQFLLESAALRLRIAEESQEITGLLDETSVTGDSIVFARARLTARAADAFLWRFNHVLSEATLLGDVAECRQLQLLRMRLMRDYAGLWLLAYRPFFKRHPAGTIA